MNWRSARRKNASAPLATPATTAHAPTPQGPRALAPHALAPATRWPRQPTVAWLLLSALPVGLLWALQTPLMAFWQWTVASWAGVLGLSWSSPAALDPGRLALTAVQDGSFAPSQALLGGTALAALALWWLSGRLADRFYPLKICLRALCLIQWTACLFFALTPASFPYTIRSHASTLLDTGFGFMLAIGPMLALGWGILRVPLRLQIGAPLAVLAYFALMLPHKTLLHIWLLEHLSILFMPLLFLCLGALLDLWIFVALYAWLASTVPTQALPATARAHTPEPLHAPITAPHAPTGAQTP